MMQVTYDYEHNYEYGYKYKCNYKYRHNHNYKHNFVLLFSNKKHRINELDNSKLAESYLK